jgi:hypothetical protein
LTLHDRQAVVLEFLGGGALSAKLLPLVDKSRVELRKGLEVEPGRWECARRDQPPQSWYRHGSCIGATAPKLRPAPHTREGTEKVG